MGRQTCSGRELPVHGYERVMLCYRYGELLAEGASHEEALDDALSHARFAGWYAMSGLLGEDVAERYIAEMNELKEAGLWSYPG